MMESGRRPERARRSLFFLAILGTSALAVGQGPGREEPASKKAEAPKDAGKRKPSVPTKDYSKRSIEGWTVLVNKRLLSKKSELGAKAVRLLEVRLYEIRRVVPPAACRKLQEVPIWLGVDDGIAPCAEYHPSREFLVEHGHNPDKAMCVEIGNAARFVEWATSQPMMVLHELAHAYHHRVLGYEYPTIKEAFRNAADTGLYDPVLRYTGETERAYALANDREYFAEASEAFFGTNDFYPFVRPELRRYDPMVYKVLEEAWGRGE